MNQTSFRLGEWDGVPVMRQFWLMFASAGGGGAEKALSESSIQTTQKLPVQKKNVHFHNSSPSHLRRVAKPGKLLFSGICKLLAPRYLHNFGHSSMSVHANQPA